MEGEQWWPLLEEEGMVTSCHPADGPVYSVTTGIKADSLEMIQTVNKVFIWNDQKDFNHLSKQKQFYSS